MATKSTGRVSLINAGPRGLILAGVLLAVILIWLLVHFVYENPNIIFYSMINNSLSTSSFSKKVTVENNGALDTKLISVETGAKNIAISEENQTGTGVSSGSVSTLSIGTPTTDYSKFLSITTGIRDANGTLLSYSPLIGVWSKNIPAASSTSGKLFSDAILGSVVPIGNVSPAQRDVLMKYIKLQKIYNIEGKVKRQLVNGHSEYTYSVSIDLPKYALLLHMFGVDLGLKLPPVNPNNYTGVLEAAYISVNPLSRQLVEVDYVGSKTTETFTSFGAKYNISEPTKTIPLITMETKLNTIGNK